TRFLLLCPAFLSNAVVFFFSSYGNLRHLHSFPTRRSSDLFDLLAVLQCRPAAPLDLRERGLELAAGLFDLADGAGLDAGREKATDRKSTRLNSSHVKISYAVFC